MNCVILQPSYIPWRGYFHQIAKADVFVFYDDIQYDKRGWRNRNRIQTPHGPRWLTVPVHSRGAQTENIPINQIRICWDRPWNREHWETIRMAYCKTPYFPQVGALLQPLYARHWEYLADFTIELSISLAHALGITHTRFLRSSEMTAAGAKTDRLITILRQLGATHYITGPSARDYIEEDKFHQAGITLEYMRYRYLPYEPLYPPYDPQVSIIELMCLKGPEAIRYFEESDEEGASRFE